MIIKLTNINLNNLESVEADILLNKKLTNVSPSNMYEILFDCESFDSIFNIFLQSVKDYTNDNFDVYIKNMWGYIQTPNENDSINFNINFKNQITIPSNYSFIYLVKSNATNIDLKKENGDVEKILLNEGDLLIFNTKDFLTDVSTDKNRIVLIGSIAECLKNTEPIKKALL